MRTEVHKFGGTSVGSPERIAAVAQLVEQQAQGKHLVVVSSAMTKVTDQLVAAAGAAKTGERERGIDLVHGIRARHREALAALGGSDEVAAEIEQLCEEAEYIVRASIYLGEVTSRARDRLFAMGEKLAIRLVALALRKRGVDAIAIDADTFLETDGSFGEAEPVGSVSDRTTAAALREHLQAGRVPVVTGFVGRAPDGATTTLGRGGSDYTATLVAAALRADEVTIWTDVDGVFTTDPRIVPEARVLDQLNYREAAEMSFYGAKVLHQRTMIPVSTHGIPVRTRNTMNPSAPGTVVDGGFTPGSHPVKAITAIRDQSLISVEGKGMAGVPGVAARVFSALAARDISVTMISQSSSESSITFAVPGAQAREATTALKAAFRPDLARGDIEEVVRRDGVGLVAAVGLGMANTPGVAARVFGCLAASGANVLAIAQGSSELNISLALQEQHIASGIRALHKEFKLDRIDTGVEHPRGFDLMLLGCGSIGRELVHQLLDTHEHVWQRYDLKPRVVAVCDRSGFVLDPAGLPRDRLTRLLDHKAAGSKLAAFEGAVAATDPVDMVHAAMAYRLSRPVLVDVSDAGTSVGAFLAALEAGGDVATANKKPVADSFTDWTALQAAAAASRGVLRAEATVGAGLPVVDTLEMLVDTGDQLRSATGALSGTLGFLMTRLQEGHAFSAAVREAVELGYTEPDPVADLSGADVARKAIILGRISGLVPDDTPVQLEGLVPAEWAGTPLPELFERLQTLDEAMARRLADADAQGKAVRYVARVQAGSLVVGPQAVAKDSALGGLSGTDNMIVFESRRYNDRPLVVSGPGAGIQVTAMGVLGDIFRIARERA